MNPPPPPPLPLSPSADQTIPRLLLPPPFRAHAAGPGGDLMDLAAARAGDGAGTMLWRQAGGVLGLALILEPAPPLATRAAEAELGFLAGLAALTETLARHARPERAVTIGWPDRVFYDAARLAGARWRTGPAGADGLPEWAVFGVEIIAAREGLDEPGRHPDSTSLAEEGFPEAAELIESFAAFLKLIVDRWTVEGPEAVLRRVLDRVRDRDALGGARIEAGRLVLPPLAPLMDEAIWRDAARGGPAW